jgi:AhpD family alkylhydroperoxidase
MEENVIMQARMANAAMILPEAMQALLALGKAAEKGGLPSTTIALVQLRASQINSCSVCVDMHTRGMKQAGETDERLFTVAAWRDAPYFTDAERAVLALTEAVTRLSDRPDPVPDEVWNEAARHYDERGLAALLVAIGTINVWNRLNVATRQVAFGKLPEHVASA